MGPFGFPWLTFSAILVTAATVIIALVWAGFMRRRSVSEGEDET